MGLDGISGDALPRDRRSDDRARIGLGFTTGPATESIMGSLSADKAGIGSAVNDTSRELGGTLGVAVLGSVFSSVYVSTLDDGSVFSALPQEARDATADTVGAAGAVAQQLDLTTANAFLREVSEAFLSGLSVASLVAAAVAAAGSLLALRMLPARAR